MKRRMKDMIDVTDKYAVVEIIDNLNILNEASKDLVSMDTSDSDEKSRKSIISVLSVPNDVSCSSLGRVGHRIFNWKGFIIWAYSPHWCHFLKKMYEKLHSLVFQFVHCCHFGIPWHLPFIFGIWAWSGPQGNGVKDLKRAMTTKTFYIYLFVAVLNEDVFIVHVSFGTLFVFIDGRVILLQLLINQHDVSYHPPFHSCPTLEFF